MDEMTKESAAGEINDAILSRTAWKQVEVEISGQRHTVSIPGGYELLKLGAIEQIRREGRERIDRLQLLVAKVEAKVKELREAGFHLTDVIVKQEQAAKRQREKLRLYIEQNAQYRAALGGPIRWVVRTLMGRAVSLELRERNKAMKKDLEVAASLAQSAEGTGYRGEFPI